MSTSPSRLVCFKTHRTQGREIISIADPDLLGRSFRDGKVLLRISEKFYGGKEIPIEDALYFIRKSPSLNLVGSIVDEAIKQGIIHPDAVLRIRDQETGDEVSHLIMFHM